MAIHDAAWSSMYVCGFAGIVLRTQSLGCVRFMAHMWLRFAGPASDSVWEAAYRSALAANIILRPI